MSWRARLLGRSLTGVTIVICVRSKTQTGARSGGEGGWGVDELGRLTEKVASYGVPEASLWACLIRAVTSQETAAEPTRALVSTRRFLDGSAGVSFTLAH